VKKFLALVIVILAFPVLAQAHEPNPSPLAQPLPGSQKAPKLDLNLATLQQLCTLPGIGAKKAKAIIAYREKRPFSRITQLVRVKGIGPKTVRRLKERLTVHSGPLPAPK
jgi:competence ComEA-like helix-hairpin-helix protein